MAVKELGCYTKVVLMIGSQYFREWFKDVNQGVV